jgi:hypothetical protein
MPTVFIALPRERNADFPSAPEGDLDLPEKLHFYFIVRKGKWMSCPSTNPNVVQNRTKERESS